MYAAISNIPGFYFTDELKDPRRSSFFGSSHPETSIIDVITSDHFNFCLYPSSPFRKFDANKSSTKQLWGSFDVRAGETKWSYEPFPEYEEDSVEIRQPDFFVLLLPYPLIEMSSDKSVGFVDINPFSEFCASKKHRNSFFDIDFDLASSFNIVTDKKIFTDSTSQRGTHKVNVKSNHFWDSYSRAFPIITTNIDHLLKILIDFQAFLSEAFGFQATLSNFSKCVIPYFKLNGYEHSKLTEISTCHDWYLYWHRVKKCLHLADVNIKVQLEEKKFITSNTVQEIFGMLTVVTVENKSTALCYIYDGGSAGELSFVLALKKYFEYVVSNADVSESLIVTSNKTDVFDLNSVIRRYIISVQEIDEEMGWEQHGFDEQAFINFCKQAKWYNYNIIEDILIRVP
ncbi:MAG TPA: hypothetical protein VL093_01850 [Flavipsychrobacter sp.]|jgi:hypothetical protein|nr:hypothetical protein [Flavipsychrobacter sp.]